MSHRITFLWTVPRSVSTSFERMMMERGDHVVFDEPFSRSYYFGPDRRSTRYTESLPDSSAEQILSQIEEAAGERPVFVKDMAYQAATLLGTDLLKRFGNCFLVRDPAATSRSLAHRWPDFSDEETGWEWHASSARSTGFRELREPPPPPTPEDGRLHEVYQEALPLYRELSADAIGKTA